MKTLKPSDGAEQDNAALADQWADRNWYLPAGGDQSWREREARRRFGPDGKRLVKDAPEPQPAEQPGVAPEPADAAYEPGFRRAGARKRMLPVALAAGAAVLFAGGFLVPEMLPPDFWSAREPEPRSGTPVHIIAAAAAQENMTPGLIYGEGAERDTTQIEDRSRQAATPLIETGEKTALPRLRPPVTPRSQHDRPAARVAKVQPPAGRPAGKRTAKSLPPIGEAYFAGHARARAVATPVADLPPIGEAYFASRSPSAD